MALYDESSNNVMFKGGVLYFASRTQTADNPIKELHSVSNIN